MSEEELRNIEFEKPIENLNQLQDQYIEQQLKQNKGEIVTKLDVEDVTQTISELGLNTNRINAKRDPLKAEREHKQKFLQSIKKS